MIIVTDRRERFNPKEAQLSPAQALLALCKVLTDTFPRRYVECVRQEGETLRVVVTEEVSPLNTTTFQGTQKEMERLLKATATFIRTIHFYHNRCKNVDEKSTDILLPFFTNNQTFDWPFTSQDHVFLFLTALDFERDQVVKDTYAKLWRDDDLITLASWNSSSLVGCVEPAAPHYTYKFL